MSIERLAVIGGGAWGTALAQVAAQRRARHLAVGAASTTSSPRSTRIHENPVFLPGAAAAPAIRATGDLADLAELRRLAGGHPGPAHARGARAARRTRASR